MTIPKVAEGLKLSVPNNGLGTQSFGTNGVAQNMPTVQSFGTGGTAGSMPMYGYGNPIMGTVSSSCPTCGLGFFGNGVYRLVPSDA